MATTKVTVTSSWVQVAAADKEFLIENLSSADVRVAFADSTPASDAAAHILQVGEALVRMSLAGAVYVRNDIDADSAFVIVSTS